MYSDDKNITSTAKEILEKYQVRKTKKQKTAFLEFAKQIAERRGYPVRVEKGAFGVRNLVIGNPDTARVLYTAHYDTCPRLPFPNFITPKSFLIYLLYQFLIVGGLFALIFALSFACAFAITHLPSEASWGLFYLLVNVPQVVYILFLFLLLGGPANKHTANDNTSGVTTVLDLVESLPLDQKDAVAFVLFDLEEAGLFGSMAFASKHKNAKKNTLMINFDCVSDGKTILFSLKRSTKQYADLLKEAFLPTSEFQVDITAKSFYPSDNSVFRRGIGVAALKKSKHLGILYMNRIHTKKDVVYQGENIRYLVNGAIKLVELLSGRTAWYLDEDVLLEGTVIRNRFYADRNVCGFDVQEFDESVINKTLFFDLEKAISVCGDVPIVKLSPSRRRMEDGNGGGNGNRF